MIAIHAFYRDVLVSKLAHIHVDFYFRPDAWLLDPNSTVTYENVGDFADLIVAWQQRYHVGAELDACLRKISPWHNRYWLDEEVKFKARAPVDVYYEYSFPDESAATALRIGQVLIAALMIFDL